MVFSGAATARTMCEGGSRPPALVLRPAHTVRLGTHLPLGTGVCRGRHLPLRAGLLPSSPAIYLAALTIVKRAVEDLLSALAFLSHVRLLMHVHLSTQHRPCRGLGSPS